MEILYILKNRIVFKNRRNFMKSMKTYITNFILFIGLSIHAQSYKSFTPTKGEIIFREISKITDRKSFNETFNISKQKFKESLKKSLLKDADNVGNEKEIEQMVNNSSEMLETTVFSQDSMQMHHHQFSNSQIKSFVMEDKNIIRDDNITEENYPYSTNIILKTTVNKQSKKIILGYDCYKVIYEFKESNQLDDANYLEYAGKIVKKREMWVTDKIKFLYHPVIYEKEILEKYYPLDILETQSDVKGFERRFVLQKITLQ